MMSKVLKIIIFPMVIALVFILSACAMLCDECNLSIASDLNYCKYCGAVINGSDGNFDSIISDEKAILGTWTTTDDWGDFEYSFYSDGSLKGFYKGKTGNVYPSLCIDGYYDGAGDGEWSFVDGKLKVVYYGEKWGADSGVLYYDYELSSDNNELTIYYNTGNYELKTVWSRLG